MPLAAERQGGTSNLPGGVTFAHWWSYAASSLCTRSSPRAPTTVDNWACPVGPHFVAQISPFSVDSGAFSIVGRIRDESAVGSHGEIYRGWGARNRSRKSRKLDGWEEQFAKKGCNTRTSQGVTHPSTTLAQARLNFGVLMGSGALVLRSDRWDVESSGGRNFAHWWSYAASSLCTRSSPRAPRRGQLGLPRWATFRGPNFAVFGGFRARFRSLAAFVMSRPWGLRGRYTGVGVCGTVEKKQEAGRRSDRWDVESSGGRNFAHWWSLRREQPMHAKLAASSTTWTTGLAPLGHISWPKFRVFGGFRRVFRSLAAFVMSRPWGSHGEIYRGWVVRGTVEKKQGSWTGGRSISQKGVQHEDFPGGHPSYGATGGTSNLPGGVTLRTGGAYAASSLCTRSSPASSTTWTTGLAPLGHISWPKFPVFGGFRRCFRSLAAFVMSRPWGLMGRYTGVGVRGTVEKKQEAGRVGGAVSQKGVQHETSQGVTHPSTTLAQARLTSEWDVESSGGGVTLRTGGATPRAAYAREARRRAPRRGQLGLPRWPHFVAQISPFSVDSGAFSIVGRIRDESGRGSQGEIYRVGVCGGTVEKKQEAGRVGGAFRKKGCNTRTSQGSPILCWYDRTPLRYARFNLLCSGSGSDSGTSNLPGGVTLRTGGATPRAAYAREARRELHDVDNWACPLGHISWPKFRRFSVDSGAFSIVGRIRDESPWGLMGRYTGVGVRGTVEKKQEAGRRSDRWDVESSGGRNLCALVELRREQPMHAKLAASSTTWTTGLAPLGHIFVAQISPFSVDSGAFSIVGRIRDESAVGSHGEIYRGWGCAERSRKSGKLDGWEEQFAKRVQHEDFPGGHPS
ncbi:UNVERIFIED_CONTAM: hypothetical protein Sindi_2920400 [Sesamum indicum]